MNYMEKTKIHITQTIKKVNKTSKFLNEIDINKTYSRNDLLVILENAGFKQPKSYIGSFTKIDKLESKKKYGFQCIFENVGNDHWKIFEDLKSAWN